MLNTDIVEGTQDPSVAAEVDSAYAIFVVDDNACTRCSVCVERCPSDVLYYARLPEGDGGARAMASVPMSQQADEDAG
jgi:ferredoxin